MHIARTGGGEKTSIVQVQLNIHWSHPLNNLLQQEDGGAVRKK